MNPSPTKKALLGSGHFILLCHSPSVPTFLPVDLRLVVLVERLKITPYQGASGLGSIEADDDLFSLEKSNEDALRGSKCQVTSLEDTR